MTPPLKLYGSRKDDLTGSRFGVLGTAVFSRSDRDLEVRADGRYRAAGGRWRRSPASFTLTLRPDGDGGGVRTGPTSTLACGATRKEKDVAWTLPGECDWWKK